MELPRRIILACGNAAILDERENVYRCNFCYEIIGSADEPPNCKTKREQAEPFKNDYWMDIDNDTEQY
jgi:hypothetical protein